MARTSPVPERSEIVVLGAGPTGIEAALAARIAGHEVAVLEAGTTGDSVLRWGHVRLFSPWRMNCSVLGRRQLEREREHVPDGDGCPTGREFVEQYLLPLARSAPLANSIHTGVTAVAAARANTLKGDAIGDDRRADAPFRVLWRRQSAGGKATEGRIECRVLIDATGVYRTPALAGSGGIPAAGELDAADLIERHLPDVLGADRRRFAGRHTIVVGAGYSAATAIRDLAALARDAPSTRATWLVRRTDGAPLRAIAGDPLPERRALTAEVNALAASGASGIRIVRGAGIEQFRLQKGGIAVRVLAAGAESEIAADRVLALTGYRPALDLLRELQVHYCYATEGLMKVSAALLAEGGAGADCLTATSGGTAALQNPEPGLFVVGSKSYGRFAHYLLRSGCEQVESVIEELVPRYLSRPRPGGAS
ncbi:MAG: NAD(P)-binding domain-containing protein [Planctomycetes bacterium]|nr:NAD(P)-binding domain-containing protein [Planctomycetota bacterium]